MNVIFGAFTIISMIILLFINPDSVFSAFMNGAEKALGLSTKMIIIHAVWMGVLSLLEKSGLSEKFAKILRPLNKFLFGDIPEKANDYMALNISANALGMSGATTPMGIKSIKELEKHKGTEYAIAMFFVVNATSIQIIPTSVIALRTSLGSISPADIILPTILATLLSTVIGVTLVKTFLKRKKHDG